MRTAVSMPEKPFLETASCSTAELTSEREMACIILFAACTIAVPWRCILTLPSNMRPYSSSSANYSGRPPFNRYRDSASSTQVDFQHNFLINQLNLEVSLSI